MAVRAKFPANLAQQARQEGFPALKTSLITRARKFVEHGNKLKVSPHSILPTHLGSILILYEHADIRLAIEFFNDGKQSWALALPEETLAAEFVKFPTKVFIKFVEAAK